jgi:hypothetical protein
VCGTTPIEWVWNHVLEHVSTYMKMINKKMLSNASDDEALQYLSVR